MITWRDVKKSLEAVDDIRLDDPAHVMIEGELEPFDIIEIDVEEIDDIRLIGFPVY